MNSGNNQDDPLHPLNLQSAITHTNPRGRPRKTISFCPQRKSIVSQILSEIKRIKEEPVTKSMLMLRREDLGVGNEEAKETDLFIDHTIPSDASADDRCTTKISVARCKKKEKREISKQCRSYKRTKSNNDICRGISNVCTDEEQINDEVMTYSCDYPKCPYVSKIMSNLSKHKRIHTNERPYMCDKCTFRTNFVNSLKVHRRIHTSEHPYCCELCGHRSNSISNLKKHRLHRHQNASKSIVCQ